MTTADRIAKLRDNINLAVTRYGAACIYVGTVVHGGTSPQRVIDRAHADAKAKHTALMSLVAELANLATEAATPAMLSLPPAAPERERDPARRAALRLARRPIGGDR